MAAAYKLFEYAEVDNPAQIVRSKSTLVEHVLRNALANPVKQKKLQEQWFTHLDNLKQETGEA